MVSHSNKPVWIKLFLFIVRNLMRASNARAVEIVVKVLNAHPANADVAQQGCRALTHLALYGFLKKIL